MILPMELAVNSIPATRRSSKIPAFVLLLLLLSLSAASQYLYASTDGPATLPLALVPTSMANTPAPGITITVKSGENLQTALNNAKCGDTIHVQA